MSRQRKRRLLLINDSIAASLLIEGKASTAAAKFAITDQSGNTAQSLTAKGLLLCGLLSQTAAGFNKFSLYEIGRRCGVKGGYRSSKHRAAIINELETLKNISFHSEIKGRYTVQNFIEYSLVNDEIEITYNALDSIQEACGGGVFMCCEALTGYYLSERAARVLLWAVKWCKLTAASKADYTTASKGEFYSFVQAKGSKETQTRAKRQLQAACNALQERGGFLHNEINLEIGSQKRLVFYKKRPEKGTKRVQKGTKRAQKGQKKGVFKLCI